MKKTPFQNLGNFEDVTLRELKILREIPSSNALRGLAQTLQLQPQHLSKIVKSLEGKLGTSLVTRSSKGIIPTPESIEIAKLASQILKLSEDLLQGPGSAEKFSESITAGARGFLNLFLTSPGICRISKSWPQTRFRVVDLSPKQTYAAARAQMLDIILTFDIMDLGETWARWPIGKTQFRLYARRDHPLPRVVQAASLAAFPIVQQSYFDGEKLVESNDALPLKAHQKRKGFAVETALEALQVVADTDHLAFLPNLCATDMVVQGRIKEIHVDGMSEMNLEISMYASQDRVKQRLATQIAEELQRILTERKTN